MAVKKRERISDIIAASLLNELDDKGKSELSEWLNESPLNRNFYEALQESFSSGEAFRELSRYDSVGDWVSVKRKAARNRRRAVYQKTLYAAAALIGVSALFSVFLIPFAGKKPYDGGLSAEYADTALKENYKALLILSSGNTLDLGEKLELDGGKIKNDGTTLEYNSRSDGHVATEQPQIHILKVPRGAEYKLVLADGTTVHLNADSELRYPEHFEYDNRTVELIGEAYFEVAHNPERPFIAVNGDMKITVLGTSFNLKAYNDADRQTTLAEGHVRIENQDSCIEISPGQQAYEIDNKLLIREVKTGEHLGWRNKRLIYKSTPLETVAQDIGRYYDKKVVFSDEITHKLRLTANIPRYENIEQVLDIISHAIYVSISVDGDLITVHGQEHRN